MSTQNKNDSLGKYRTQFNVRRYASISIEKPPKCHNTTTYVRNQVCRYFYRNIFSTNITVYTIIRRLGNRMLILSTYVRVLRDTYVP